MSIAHSITRTSSLSVAALLCMGSLALAPAAQADPGNAQSPAQGQGQGQPPASPGNGNGNGNASNPGAPAPGTPAPGDAGNGKGNHGNGNAGNGPSHPAGQGKPAKPGKPGKDNPGGNSSGSTNQGGSNPGNGGAPSSSNDPAGNNGTVKIAPLGDFDGIPNNTPHVGCSFLVEWYGFDQGADIISTVSFAEQAPTTGVGMTVSGPSQVFVGGDPASGAGTATGLDGRQQYTLSFTGAPHPQQGYHVKLTIHTPGSIGNDTKSKVFWVEGCAAPTPTTPTTPPTEGGTTPTTPGSTTPDQETSSPAPEVEAETAEAPGSETAPETAPEVLGVQAFGAQVAPSTARRNGPNNEALPTAVNAGAAGSSTTAVRDGGATALLGMMLLVLGAITGRLGWTRARG
ncbi:hypothetical protein ASG76_12140 [Nocardioides sp. Soil774]|uniref:hypothetical protein n=1 Tax=Nocardioides sp. Soil774 TaxID=1736408 RepID=UPI0006FAA0F2|nr:hypothetical protein [Nocardioides sp. Soil774]KRE94136.1 hypothetical protein ASG76_12140 [Nocardioides sp. Soil774]